MTEHMEDPQLLFKLTSRYWGTGGLGKLGKDQWEGRLSLEENPTT